MTELRGSDISIGWDYFNRLREIIDFSMYASSFLLTDNNIFELYSEKIRRLFNEELERERYYILEAGEGSKTLEKVGEIGDKMLSSGLERKSVLIALGGGVVTDIAGLSASLFMRGIDFVNVPTTLVGQIDASLGGKCGVNLDSAKNIMGLFSPPRTVIIDPGFLDTLTKNQINDGIVELLKIAAVADTDLFASLESIRCDMIGVESSRKIELIERAARLKLAIVARDFREGGYRKILNFGHTTGHAIEACRRYGSLSHGRAVALGMLVAIELSEFICGLSISIKERLGESIKILVGKERKINIGGDELWAKILFDKKRDAGDVKFTLLEDIGAPQLKTVIKDQFLTAYKTVCREFSL